MPDFGCEIFDYKVRISSFVNSDGSNDLRKFCFLITNSTEFYDFLNIL